jgi:signal transduction histidine kinase
MTAGEIHEQREVPLPLERDGKLEETFWTSIYQPLRRRDGSIEGVMTFDQEVTTEKKRVQEQLQLLELENQILAEKAKVQEFQERFIAILGHDLRNPLAAIDMGTGVLRQKAERDRDAAAARILERMRSSSRRMSRMIEQILDLTRSRLARGLEMTPTEVDLVATLTGVADELRTAHPTRVIDLRAPTNVLGMWDRDRLEQVFSNLVGNAVHYGLGEKPVTIRVGHQAEADGPVTVDVHNEGDPIPEDVLATLFSPFRRGDRDSRRKATEGLGLGLFISREVVVAHGGEIEVHSSASEGTTFRVTLPRRPSPSPRAPHDSLAK